jgi:hydroxyethylthiazole kinase-like uncharacterized protein yjeF
MKIATADEMREIDRLTQTDYDIPADLLMEKAALAALEVMEQTEGGLTGKLVYLCCGRGNNGGDGLALARLLMDKQAQVMVILAAEPGSYTGLAEVNLRRAQRFGVEIVTWESYDKTGLEKADLVVDALLGTGSRGVPRETIARLIVAVNELRKPVYALDLPSGIGVDTGQVNGVAVKAMTTITFGLPQPGLMIYPGAEYAGKVVVASLGFPRPLLENGNLNLSYLTRAEIRTFLPRRKATDHKGANGHLLIIGGSPGMTGAVGLAARGALRSGSGLVTIALRDCFCQEKPTEAILTGWEGLPARMKTCDGIVIGPGMSTAADGRELLIRLLENSRVPLLIDADGLNLLARETDMLKKCGAPVTLTPHPGEMARLTGLEIKEIQSDRLGIARQYAGQWGVVLILKGARTIIALPDGTAYINLTGNEGMATAGTGDVLAGMVGALAVQGVSPGHAAVLGAYLHGLAGDLAAEYGGTAGMIAGDVADHIPEAYRRILGTDYRESQSLLRRCLPLGTLS